MSDYLWDKTGEPDADVEQLENLLGSLKYQPRPLEISASAMPSVAAATRPTTIFFSRPRLAVAASLLLTLLAGLWFVTRQGEPQKNQVATVNKGSETVESRPPEQAVVTGEQNGNNASDDNASRVNDVAPKPREGRAGIVTASAPKVRRATRGLVAGRQKLQPRRMSIEDAPAPRESLASNGMRWQVEEPMTPQQREATEKLMLALQVASTKFNYARREMAELGRAGK
ncbi:MAG TPA: hypothetical protein VF634_04995 [Pyrinomonadaceae bacterium]|jgi:hypothetical protein